MRPNLPIQVLTLVIITATGCASRYVEPAPQQSVGDNFPIIRVAVGTGQHIQKVYLEEYVRGSVPAEMPLSASNLASASQLAQLQSILARTYALANLGRHSYEGFDLCSTTHCQIYRSSSSPPSRISKLVSDAVARTEGLIITDGNGPIQAVFHADCGGHTSSATAIWGGLGPVYLSGVEDQLCKFPPRDSWLIKIAPDQLRDILNAHRDTRVGQRLDSVVVLRYDQGGRATEVMLEGTENKKVRGERLRSIISGKLGGRVFRSSQFTVHVTSGQFLFQGTGFGHGVGLCQLGAIARVRRGDSLESILGHYYPGTWIEPHSVQPTT
ncbi:MAG: hypothetical protein CL484_02965 [Acidobacteria bacterium]|nr:hypothetical protein [Acidobacteriota bacterium]